MIWMQRKKSVRYNLLLCCHDTRDRRCIGDTLGQARAHNNLGMLFTALHNYTKALEHYRHELMIRLQVGSSLYSAG